MISQLPDYVNSQGLGSCAEVEKSSKVKGANSEIYVCNSKNHVHIHVEYASFCQTVLTYYKYIKQSAHSYLKNQVCSMISVLHMLHFNQSIKLALFEIVIRHCVLLLPKILCSALPVINERRDTTSVKVDSQKINLKKCI